MNEMHVLETDMVVSVQNHMDDLPESDTDRRTWLEHIVHTYGKMVFRVAYYILHSVEESEDVCQDVFLRVYRYASSRKAKARIEPWLYQITVNVCRDVLKRKKRQYFIRKMLPFWRQTTDDPPPDVVVESASDRKTLLEYGLQQLSDRKRLVIVLRDIEDLPVSQVADLLELSPSGVRTLLSRARIKMRQHCQKFSGGQS